MAGWAQELATLDSIEWERERIWEDVWLFKTEGASPKFVTELLPNFNVIKGGFYALLFKVHHFHAKWDLYLVATATSLKKNLLLKVALPIKLCSPVSMLVNKASRIEHNSTITFTLSRGCVDLTYNTVVCIPSLADHLITPESYDYSRYTRPLLHAQCCDGTIGNFKKQRRISRTSPHPATIYPSLKSCNNRDITPSPMLLHTP